MGGEISSFLEEFLAQILSNLPGATFTSQALGLCSVSKAGFCVTQEANTPQASRNAPNGRRPWGSLPLLGSSKEARHLGSELLEK